jgi:hypothetical protein
MFTRNKYIAKLNDIKEGCLGLYHFSRIPFYIYSKVSAEIV